jgi:hypothetical protein
MQVFHDDDEEDVTIEEQQPAEGEEEESPPEEEKETEEEETADAEEETTVTIDDEPNQEQDSSVIRELRRRHRQKEKENRELQNQLAALRKPAEIGPEPTLEDCDWDEAVLKSRWKEWNNKQEEKRREAAAAREEENRKAQEWQRIIESYNEKKSQLGAPDYDDAEEVVKMALNGEQQSIILEGAENPERVFYALGKNPQKMEELAKIDSHAKFAFAVSKLEGRIKVEKRKPKTNPEKKVTSSGGASVSGGSDKTLARLQAAADKSGDRSEVVKYMAKLREKAA